MAKSSPPAAQRPSKEAQEVMEILRGNLKKFGITLFVPPGKDGGRDYLTVASVAPKYRLGELNLLLTDLGVFLSKEGYQVSSVVFRVDDANMYPGRLTVNDAVVVMVCPTIETATRQRRQGHLIPSLNLPFEEHPDLRNVAI